MKSFLISIVQKNLNSGTRFLFERPVSSKAALYLSILSLAFLVLAGCKKEDLQSDLDEVIDTKSSSAKPDAQILNEYSGLSKQTLWELEQARSATARYRHIENAIKDGYADIEVVVQNMGFHYMKSSLVDASFDIRKPEILVYNKNMQGIFELVAVEYAIPIHILPNAAPEGFSGSQDVWDRNTGFGLWLLHAWVWSYNPSGVFNPSNPLIHLH